jgi:hypothetical protein
LESLKAGIFPNSGAFARDPAAVLEHVINAVRFNPVHVGYIHKARLKGLPTLPAARCTQNGDDIIIQLKIEERELRECRIRL